MDADQNRVYLLDKENMKTALLKLGIPTMAGMLLFFDPLINILGATESSFAFAKAYGIIFIIGLVFNVFNMMMNNLIVAEGGSFYGMTAMLAGGLVNLVLDPVLIFGCNMGVAGGSCCYFIIPSCINCIVYYLLA